MVGLEERPPHLQEIQVSDGGYHDIQLIFQQGSCRDSRHHRRISETEKSNPETKAQREREREKFSSNSSSSVLWNTEPPLPSICTGLLSPLPFLSFTFQFLAPFKEISIYLLHTIKKKKSKLISLFIFYIFKHLILKEDFTNKLP